MFTLALGIIGVCGFAVLTLRYPDLRISQTTSPQSVSVSVVIPVRNEEHNLPHLLQSLADQSFRALEIIVVDDGSTDRSAEIAREYGAGVITSPQQGGRPKPVALHKGYEVSMGDIVVFLDADVILDKDFLDVIQSRFASSDVDCISIQPTHNCHSFVDQLSHFFHIASITGSGLFTPLPINVGLFGPCIAMRRSGYELTGGFAHESVARSFVEDVELGKVLKNSNSNVERYIGKDLISYRMYTTFTEFFMGWRKNIVRGAKSASPLVGFILVAYFGFLLSAPVTIAANGHDFSVVGLYMLSVLLLMSASFKLGRYHWAVLMYPVTLVMFFAVFACSAFDLVFKRNVRWKDREIKS